MADRFTQDSGAPLPWQPRPLSIAVLDSDEHLADALCARLRESGFAASAFYDIGALLDTHREKRFDGYVLDFLADWQPQSSALDGLVASIRGGPDSDVPIFILGNDAAPERTPKLGGILMRHRVRYLVRPLRIDYLARSVGEAVLHHAGI